MSVDRCQFSGVLAGSCGGRPNDIIADGGWMGEEIDGKTNAGSYGI